MRRNFSIHIKLSQIEKEKLNQLARDQEMDVSKWIRHLIFENNTQNEDRPVKEEQKISPDRRKNVLVVRVSNAEYLLFKKLAKDAGLSLSEFIRRQAKNNKIVVIPGFHDFTRQLRKIGINLNQITFLANSGKIYAVELQQTKEAIKEMWSELLFFLRSQKEKR